MLLAELFPYANAVFYVFTALYIITAIGCIIVVVSENRNPVRSLAWVTVLLLLPVVGILVYLFFGRSLKSVMMISRNNRMKRRGQVSLNTPESSNFSLSESSLQIINLVNSLGEPHFFKTNQVDIFTEGEAKFSQLKADLLAAKKYINFQYYIFSADTIGKELAEILIQKAHEGVKVRVIYDHVGSWSIASSFFKHLREEGVEAYPFLKVTFPQLANRLNWRNHRKVVVIDGEMGYIGGMNIADRYVTGEKGYKAWRDTHLRIVGDAVKGLQFSFAIDWNFMKRMLLDQPCTSTIAPKAETVGMQIVISGPTPASQRHVDGAAACHFASAKVHIYPDALFPARREYEIGASGGCAFGRGCADYDSALSRQQDFEIFVALLCERVLGCRHQGAALHQTNASCQVRDYRR